MIKSNRGNKSNDNDSLSYPKLVKSDSDNIIVFMVTHGEGLCVYDKENLVGVGCYSSAWDVYKFTDYHGIVSLENKEGV